MELYPSWRLERHMFLQTPIRLQSRVAVRVVYHHKALEHAIRQTSVSCFLLKVNLGAFALGESKPRVTSNTEYECNMTTQ